jgi:hypothetical protein
MSLAESACYTLINVPDTEPYNEMQIKQDLGKSSTSLTNFHHIINFTIVFCSLQKKARLA